MQFSLLQYKPVSGFCMCVDAIASEPSMLGFNEFTYKHIIPACFLAPMKPTFDLSDAQTIQVFNAYDCDRKTNR